MGLTVKSIEALKPKERLYRVADSNGLCIEVTPNGSKLWRVRYRFEGKAQMMALGKWPAVNLTDARTACSDIKKQLAHGLNPMAVAQEQKAAKNGQNTFEAFSRLWFSKHKHKWAEKTARRKLQCLESHVYPIIGGLNIDEVNPPQVRQVLRRLENLDKLHTAHRTKNIIGEIMRYAIAMGSIQHNPIPDLAGLLPTATVQHRATITDLKGIGALLRAIAEYDSPITRYAMQLAVLTFVRPGELRQAEWTEFDLAKNEWKIPASKMKMRQTHIVPLARQALNILKKLHPLTGHGKYLFPSIRSISRPMSDNTVNAALRRMGYERSEMSPHGFRAMASTNLHELGFNSDFIERQLAHAERNKVRAAYNYAEYIPERKKMMQEWANFLDKLQKNIQCV